MAVVCPFLACHSFFCLILNVIYLSLSLCVSPSHTHTPFLHPFLFCYFSTTHLSLINFDHTVGEWDGIILVMVKKCLKQDK